MPGHRKHPLKPVRVCLVADQRTGHRRQLESLVLALARRIQITAHWQQPLSAWQRLLGSQQSQSPDLVLACGRATLATGFWLARRSKAVSVALMNPRRFRGRYDLSVIPQHDGIAPTDRVLVTRGPLSPMTPGATRNPGKGLFLIGGPARGVKWDDGEVWRQLDAIISRHQIDWTLTTSRRTPVSFLQNAPDRLAARIVLVDGTRCESDWLPDQLGKAGCAWVTQDSAAMVYDALSAGAACGVLQLQRSGSSRVARGVDGLLQDNAVTGFDDWNKGANLVALNPPLAEADRVAEVICKRWFST